MCSKYIIFSILILLFASLGVKAQSSFSRNIIIRSDTLINDTLTIVSSSISYNSKADVQLVKSGNSLNISDVEEEFLLTYHVLPFNLNKRFFNRSLEVYDSFALFTDTPKKESPEAKKGWLEKKGIAHQGSISRGITLGSHQNLTMQSQMNLQLEGKLNDNLYVVADITDQQTPYLPEGNSQYLRDFDNVSIKLYNKDFLLEAGDQQWQNKQSYFGRFTRNMEGARLQYSKNSALGETKTYIGAASAKGKFAREEVKVEDGVIGPYRIPRPESSPYVVVLPGTEKIFLDGKLLERGLENDYIIDYDQGEISFTSNVIITMYSRVIIEFEYTQLSYQRNSLMAGHELNGKNYNFFIHYFSQKDNARQAFGMDLNSTALDFISMQDPELNYILLPGIDSIGYNEERIMYARRDTITATGETFSYYIHSMNPKEAFFSLAFRESNKGNYVIKQYTASGRVYQWVAPVNGVPQGNYEPEIVVNTPETEQLFTVGGSYNISKYDKVVIEYTTSNHSTNNLNPQASKSGGAFGISFIGKDRPIGFLDKYHFNHDLDFQWVQSSFNPLERVRTVEFERLWIKMDTVPQDEVLLNAAFSIRQSEDQLFNYAIMLRDKGKAQGWLHNAEMRQKFKNIYLQGKLDQVSSSGKGLTSEWLNYDVNIFYNAGAWQPGVRVFSEKNSIVSNDSLTASANNFIDKQVYLRHSAEGKGNMNFIYSHREDYLPSFGEFKKNTSSQNVIADIAFEKIDLRVNYRTLYLEGKETGEEMLSGDVTWKSEAFKIYTQNIGAGISQGRELSRAFQFVQVTPGEGTHTWRDLNADAIKDIDEFFEAINIDERNYIKILLPTDDYIPAYEGRFTYKGILQAPAKWQKRDNDLIYLLSRLRGHVNFQLSRKNTSNDWSKRLLIEESDDDELISENNTFFSRIVLNRTRERLGGTVSYQKNSRKQVYQIGFHRLVRSSWHGDLIYSFNNMMDLSLNSALTEEFIVNDYSLVGSYKIAGKMINPTLAYTLNQQWKFAAGHRLSSRYSLTNDAGAIHKEWNIDIKHSRKETFLNANMRFINIDFTGEEQSAEGYALLEAMQPGKNLYWRINLQQKLTGSLRLSLFYDGRKSGTSSAVHLGRVQLTALF